MDPRTKALRDVLDELERAPSEIPKNVLPELHALAERIAKRAAHEFVEQLMWENRDEH